MKCEYNRSNCTKPAEKRLNIRFRDTGSQSVYYYCKPHALMRISEIEDDDSSTVLSAEDYEMASSRGE